MRKRKKNQLVLEKKCFGETAAQLREKKKTRGIIWDT